MGERKRTKANGFCSACGLNHSRLGVVIDGDTLTRTAHSSRGQVLTHFGASSPAWGFLARLIDGHPEINNFVVRDEDTGETFKADRGAFDVHSFRRELGEGLQVILSFKWWESERTKTSQNESKFDGVKTRQIASPVQLAFEGIAFRVRG